MDGICMGSSGGRDSSGMPGGGGRDAKYSAQVLYPNILPTYLYNSAVVFYPKYIFVPHEKSAEVQRYALLKCTYLFPLSFGKLKTSMDQK